MVEPKEGGFSVAMPAKPIEQSQEVPTQIGKVMAKFYVCKVANGALVAQCQILPGVVPQINNLEEFEAGIEAGMKATAQGKFEVISKKAITTGNRKGLELVTTMTLPQGKLTQKAQVYVVANRAYSLLAIAAPGQTIPPEAEAFFKSIRIDDNAAVAKGASPPAMTKGANLPLMTKAAPKPESAPEPARRKQIGKIDRVDTTADATLRTFVMAMAAGDEETLRAVTLPNPDLDWLLRGEDGPARGLSELKQQVIKARVDRLKAGDRVRISGKEVHVIAATEVGRDRAALKIEGSPAYAPLQKVKGHWKVDPAPFIAAKKAAAGAK